MHRYMETEIKEAQKEWQVDELIDCLNGLYYLSFRM